MCSVCIVITEILTAPPAGSSTEGGAPTTAQELAAGDNIPAPQPAQAPQPSGTRSARVFCA
jgi:hypothetical protein